MGSFHKERKRKEDRNKLRLTHLLIKIIGRALKWSEAKQS